MNKTQNATVNREYKDTLFRMLFSDAEPLLSLYNAVNGTSYTDPNQLEIVTLENAVYMSFKNDLAFVMDFYLNLYEHQSTANPNIPLRDLFYVAAEYQKLIFQKTIYSSTLLKIPTPRFVVFYNGIDNQPERRILKLSDAYIKPVEEPELELKVLLLNINYGSNTQLLESCRMLKEYSLYVARVRKYAKIMDIEQAVEQAVNECIHEGILKNFLTKHRAEVIAVSIFEYDEVKEKELIRKAEYEEIGRAHV